MGRDVKGPLPGAHDTVAPISRALDQSEHVWSKVKEAATELASVNTTLQNEIVDGGTLAKVEQVLDQSEAVEAKVLEAAAELAAVNDALAQEIDERHELERRLSHSDQALSASRAQERRSRHDALHDAVTGLPNMTLFRDRIDHALAQGKRYTRRFAVLFVDLNEFKRVNDTHGHDMGDRVLQMVAQRLRASIRAGDTASRRGGDEFLVLAAEADAPSASALAARIRAKLSEPCQIDGVPLAVTASIGVASYPDDGPTARELIRHADLAMYAAKRDPNTIRLRHAEATAEQNG